MLGALIGAGASLASSLLGKSSSEKAQKANVANQKEFAQKGIQWKVDDAKAAGVHPLYALGANTVSFSPTAVGQDFSSIASAGQDIGRAIDATGTGDQRAQTHALTRLQLEGLGLDNDIKRAELASKLATVNGQSGPSYPSPGTVFGMDGQGDFPKSDAPGTLSFNTKREAIDPRSPSYVAGHQTGTDLLRTAQGGYSPIPSAQVAEAMESSPDSMIEWIIRNRLAVPIGYGEKPVVPGRLPWETTQYKNYQWVNAPPPSNRSFGRFNVPKTGRYYK